MNHHEESLTNLILHAAAPNRNNYCNLEGEKKHYYIYFSASVLEFDLRIDFTSSALKDESCSFRTCHRLASCLLILTAHMPAGLPSLAGLIENAKKAVYSIRDVGVTGVILLT